MNNNIISKASLLVSLIGLIVFSPQISFGQQDKKSLDISAIKAMVGCYDVEFKYTETFAPEVDYEKAYDYTSAAFEWAELLGAKDKNGKINGPYIQKHWRQDWIYEDENQYRFDGDNKWVYEPLDEQKEKRYLDPKCTPSR